MSSPDEVRAFWSRYLEGFTATTPLVVDRLPGGARRGTPTVRVLRGRFETATATALSDLAGGDRGELACLLETAWGILLGRYSQDTDVVFGVVRSFGEAPDVVPVRMRWEAGEPAARLLERQRSWAESVGRFPRPDLVELLSWCELPSDFVLFESLVAVTSKQAGEWSPPSGAEQWPLTLVVSAADPASAVVRFDDGRFDEASAQRLFSHLGTLLASMLADPEQLPEKLPLLTEVERRQILVEWNDTTVEFPHDKCLHELFEQRVGEAPDAVAVRCGEETLTYAELDARANRVAHRLQRLGVEPDMAVGVCLDRSLDMVVGMMGVSKAGGAYVPMDPTYPSDRLEFLLEDSQARVLVTQQHLTDSLPETAAVRVVLDPDAPLDESDERAPSKAGPENLAYVIYTSGSTGRPKGAVLNHRGRVNNFCDFNRRYRIGPGDCLLGVSSMSFDMSAYDVFGTLAAGGTLVVVENADKLEPARWAQLMVRHDVTVWHSVPALLEMVVGYLEHTPKLRPTKLRLALLGGDWIPLALPDRLKALAPGVHVVSMGGATEVSMDSTIYDIERTDPEWKSIPYGHPMANQLAYVLDRELQPVPVGVPAELHLGGVGVGRGYHNRPDLTEQKFIPNPFREGERLYKTGDLARWLPDGNLELLGRTDFQVKIRGFRVELGEIESAIREQEGVDECVVLAREGSGGDKRLVGYVRPRRNVEASTEHAARWAEVFDTAYGGQAASDDETFNFVSWNSSYTGEQLPAAEVREWLDTTVERILALKPRRVLEVGCGMGMLLFRIAPLCSRYVGTDISRVALDYVRPRLTDRGLGHVALYEREALDITDLGEKFDCVILNSVVANFPSVDYFFEFLRRAVAVVEPGGSVFVGDVRDHRLLEVFHTSAHLFRTGRSKRPEELISEIRRRIQLEEDLCLDPRAFRLACREMGGVASARVQIKRGRVLNELTKFRYDATLSVAGAESAGPSPVKELDWQRDSLSVTALEAALSSSPERARFVRGIPNARLSGDSLAWKRLFGNGAPAEVGEGMEPEALVAKGAELGLQVELYCSDDPFAFDALFFPQGAGADSYDVAARLAALPADLTAAACANRPHQQMSDRALEAKLRSSLGKKLPAYMVPSAFVFLDEFPLTPNGKLNRKDLPTPAERDDRRSGDVVPPSTPLERVLAGIWSEVLDLGGVGAGDRFIVLGGTSLLAAEVLARVQELFGVTTPLRDIYDLTLTELASKLAAVGAEAGVEVSAIAEAYLQVAALSEEEAEQALRQGR